MKVVCFTVSLSSGGAEHQLIILAQLLLERGYDVEIVTFSDVPDHYDVPNGAKRIVLGLGKSKVQKVLQIIKFFLHLKRETVISYGQRANMICLLPLLFNRRPKIIAGERNTTVADSFTNSLLTKYLYRRANWVVPNNRTQYDYLCQKVKYLKEKTKVIINYTDVEGFDVDDGFIPEGNNITIFCRYHQQKNIVRFVEAVKMLRDKTVQKFHFDWYGNIMKNVTEQEPAYAEMEGLIKKYHLNDVLVLHDKTSNVSSLMQKSDAVCLPSIHEGFSNTLSEAICCGKICIAGRVSDNPTMVEDGVNGYLFDPYSVDDMVRALLLFINTTIEDRLKMQTQSRRKAIELFDKEKFVESYIELINN